MQHRSIWCHILEDWNLNICQVFFGTFSHTTVTVTFFAQEKRAQSVAGSLSQATAYISLPDLFRFKAVKNIPHSGMLLRNYTSAAVLDL